MYQNWCFLVSVNMILWISVIEMVKISEIKKMRPIRVFYVSLYLNAQNRRAKLTYRESSNLIIIHQICLKFGIIVANKPSFLKINFIFQYNNFFYSNRHQSTIIALWFSLTTNVVPYINSVIFLLFSPLPFSFISQLFLCSTESLGLKFNVFKQTFRNLIKIGLFMPFIKWSNFLFSEGLWLHPYQYLYVLGCKSKKSW